MLLLLLLLLLLITPYIFKVNDDDWKENNMVKSKNPFACYFFGANEGKISDKNYQTVTYCQSIGLLCNKKREEGLS